MKVSKYVSMRGTVPHSCTCYCRYDYSSKFFLCGRGRNAVLWLLPKSLKRSFVIEEIRIETQANVSNFCSNHFSSLAYKSSWIILGCLQVTKGPAHKLKLWQIQPFILLTCFNTISSDFSFLTFLFCLGRKKKKRLPGSNLFEKAFIIN